MWQDLAMCFFQDDVYHLRKQFPFLFFDIPFKYRGCHVSFESHISAYVRLSHVEDSSVRPSQT